MRSSAISSIRFKHVHASVVVKALKDYLPATFTFCMEERVHEKLRVSQLFGNRAKFLPINRV